MKLKYSLSLVSSLSLIIILLMYTPPTNISLNEDNLQLESLTFDCFKIFNILILELL